MEELRLASRRYEEERGEATSRKGHSINNPPQRVPADTGVK